MKSMKHIIFLATIVAMVLFTSCQDLEDVNENPNEPSTVPTASLLAAAQKQMMNNVRGTGLNFYTATHYVQHLGNNTYTDRDRYQIDNSFGASGWEGLYSAITTLNEMIYLNTDPESKGKPIVLNYGSNDNQIAVCRILKVWAFQIMTDTWGDIPYHSTGSTDSDFNACLAAEGVLYPKYATQEKIYKDLLKELKEAAAMIDVSATGITKGDAIFGGKMDKWKKFANSLSLRVANRVKHKLPEAVTRINEIMADPTTYPIMEGNEDNAALAYESAAPNQAPYYNQTVGNNNRNDYSVTNTVIEFLKGTRGPIGVADPRIAFYAQKAKNIGDYVGMPFGVDMRVSNAIGGDNVSYPGTAYYAANYKEILMEYSEVEFILSENNGWSQSNYEKGIEASMKKWGVSDSDIATYIASIPAASEATVHAQKWIALFTQPNEAWSEYRRTGYPDFLVKPGEVVWTGIIDGQVENAAFIPIANISTDAPTRIYYPDTEQTLNKTSYQAGLANQGTDFLDTKIWWNK